MSGGATHPVYLGAFCREVYLGDTPTYSTCIADLYEKTGRSGTMPFVVRETTVRNQHGDAVALIRKPFILRW